MNKKISLGCDRAAHEGAYVRVRAGGPRVGIEVAGRPTGTQELATIRRPATGGWGRGGEGNCARERGGTALKRQCKQRVGLASLLSSSGRFSSAQGVSFIYPAAALPPEALPCFCSH